MFGTPIINPPQSAILGMHATIQRPVAINGKVRVITLATQLIMAKLLVFFSVQQVEVACYTVTKAVTVSTLFRGKD